jgi:hypothetical protein
MDADARNTLHRENIETVTTMLARCEQLCDDGRTEAARRMLGRIERLAGELAQPDK